MTLLLAAVVLSAAAATWAAWPLLSRATAPVADAVSGAVVDAEARKRTALAALRELEYDWLGGKLDEADYQAQRDRLSAEALAAIREADALTVDALVPDAAETPVREDGMVSDDAVSDAAAAAPSAGAPASAGTTPRLDAALAAEAGRHGCGFVNPAGSRFCAGCGKRLR